MQEIILAFAVIGVFAIVFFVIFLLGKIAEFVDKRKAFEVGIQMTINRINDGFENLSGWKDRVKNCIEDHSKEVDKKIEEKIKSIETNEGLYKKTIDELTEREREMSKVVEQLKNKPDLDPMIFEKLAKLQEEINTEIKLSNIYGKQIDDLMKIKRGHANRIDDIENKLSQLVKENGELETRTETMEAILEEMKDRIDKLSAIEKGE